MITNKFSKGSSTNIYWQIFKKSLWIYWEILSWYGQSKSRNFSVHFTDRIYRWKHTL